MKKVKNIYMVESDGHFYPVYELEDGTRLYSAVYSQEYGFTDVCFLEDKNSRFCADVYKNIPEK